ncbi:MAG: precorrin-6A synthase (deacetylating) [Nostocoides sp.]
MPQHEPDASAAAPVRVHILGVGMGPQHVTPEVAAALAECDYIVAAEKSQHDNLLAVRRAIAHQHGVEIVPVPDPERDRRRDATSSPAGYDSAVRDWHEARVAAYQTVLTERGGTAAFLVWGDSSLYDSTIRVVARLAELMPLNYDVLPGISAAQLLAARHKIVLHPIGAPVHITTGRRLREDIAAGQRNLLVMLNGSFDLTGLEDWSLWWGGNLGDPSEALIAGRVGDVAADVLAARERLKAAAGWVMDIYLVRAPGHGDG